MVTSIQEQQGFRVHQKCGDLKKIWLLEVAAYVTLTFGMLLFTLWNSKPGSEALVLIAAGNLAFYTARGLANSHIRGGRSSNALIHGNE